MFKHVFLSAVLVVTLFLTVDNVQAVVGQWYLSGSSVPVSTSNPLELELGETADLLFCVEVESEEPFLPVESYHLLLEGNANALFDTWTNLLPTPGTVDVAFHDSETVINLSTATVTFSQPSLMPYNSLTPLGSVSLTGNSIGTYNLNSFGSLANPMAEDDVLIAGTEAIIQVVPDTLADGACAPTLEPYTATATANWESDSGTNDDYVYAQGYQQAMNPIVMAYASASVTTNVNADLASITLALQGNAGLEVIWIGGEDPEDPSGGMPMEESIPSEASCSWDGTIYFDSTELGLADGTPLDVTLSALATDFEDEGWANWECTLYRDSTELASLDSENGEATFQALVGETGLRLYVEAWGSADNYFWDDSDSFDCQLAVGVSATAVPEPTGIVLLLYGCLTLLLYHRPKTKARK